MGYLAAPPGTNSHSPDEYRQHEGLRVGSMPKEQLEIVSPDRLVDKPGEAREKKDEI